VEINKLLESTSPAPRGFDSQSEYLAFLRDPASFEVPWKVQESLLEIWSDISSHIENIKKKLKEQGLNYPEINLLEKFPTENPDKLSIENLERLIERGREYRSNLLEIQEQKKLYDPEEFEKVIESLENIYDLNDKAMWFEHYITLSLKAFNEAKKITGNYPVDDENQPMCHAPGNMPDIVGNYESFDLICEVTLLTSRDQWYNEGQPVQRHIKDHMDKHGKETYSFFIAPVLHRDTVNQFWSGIRHEYEGAPLKIYPMTTDEFIGLMRTDLELRRNDDRVSRKEFQVFLDERFSKEKLEAARNVEEWMDGNRKQMSEWLQTQTERVS
jgi:hypothetical protein